MKIFENLFLKNKQINNNEKNDIKRIEQYKEIGELVKQARIQKNISIEDLSRISKIPVYSINAIENNIENIRPKYPFIRSILFKLEDCLSLRKSTLLDLLTHEIKTTNKEKKKLILRKFDFVNTWEGVLLYFLILILSIFILKKYFFINTINIQIQNIEQKSK